LILAIVTLGALLPTFFTAMGWVFLLHPRIGIINRFLMDTFGLAQAPLNVASIVGMGWVEGLGLSSIAFVMIVATYRSLDPSLEEAAPPEDGIFARVPRRSSTV
jgi:iron(III) transport system permease protein